jgi:hypothetical protein
MSTTDDTGAAHSVDAAGITHIDRESLPIVPAGQPLDVHEVYIDTVIKGHGPFRALPGQTAGSGNGYVSERDVEPAVWDLLVREDGIVKLSIEQALLEHPEDPHVSQRDLPETTVK